MNLRFVHLAGALLAAAAFSQSLKDFEKNVTEFDLPNGMHFILLERHQAPVASFYMHVNSGAVNDPGGRTGMAHMFEHMIGKGTTTVGTKNWADEEKALYAIEGAYDTLEAERRKGPRADKGKLERYESTLKKYIELAGEYVDQNAFVRLIQDNGAKGFNASTSMDYTNYFYSLPSNRAELWFLLQAEWVKRPVFREFYKERDVVREERKMRLESSPLGKLLDVAITSAFAAHPYRVAAGWASDIVALRARDAEAFWKEHYVPSNITVGISGDITAAKAKRMAMKYFGDMPPGPPPSRVTTTEPPQMGEKRVKVEDASQPFLLIAYKRPSEMDPDDAAFDVLDGIVSGGRTGMIYKELIRDKQLALQAQTVTNFPASRYPNLFLFFTVPNQGKTVEENEKAWYEIVEKLKSAPVDAATLKRVKTKMRTGMISQLDDNAGLASQLAQYHATYGDWRKMFTALEDIEKVTAADVQRVAKTYLVEKTRTVAWIVPPAVEPAKGETK